MGFYNNSWQLGWIDEQGILDSLLAKLRVALDSQDKQKRKELLLNALLNEVEAQRGKHINEQVYQLFNEDINWILNN